MSIGFDDLQVKVINKKNSFNVKVVNGGLIETNKGVVAISRDLKLNFLTQNDVKSIKIAKNFNIRCFALSLQMTREMFKNLKKFFLIVEEFLKLKQKRFKKF